MLCADTVEGRWNGEASGNSPAALIHLSCLTATKHLTATATRLTMPHAVLDASHHARLAALVLPQFLLVAIPALFETPAVDRLYPYSRGT